MSRPWLLVFIVFLIVFTSQLEWKQQFGEEIEPTPTVSLKDQYVSKRQESVKEKIILSQERNIQKLNELVRSLQEQLIQCKAENEIINGSVFALNEHLTELEQQPMLDD
ncbi:uncharacterized protein LOC111311672 [Durio zibethinus]|uniref:Uncharacterized protein LOC111311672 n=1 Tax=Durio zibethinus TaxID=66656 RepID=A0A6P6AQ32_DURZI|nr:uncharacterized protein LOC111311672 [Durio zibethinus]XP_022767000.1 uncharacterized protein LOC111311672 [Durio zibethinus]XP_022767001.1 uncharacterized protein LOC111311672 [Durio zibethinus]XP_022767002.1 uncharacterized protein LOC111311672 [Durio zibethinus]